MIDMAKISELTVEVKPVLTVDSDTALVCLGLVEMCCRQSGQTIDVRYTKPANSDGDFQVTLDYKIDERRNA